MKHQNYIIRPEMPQDYYAVEALTREAFWNVYVPGCYEHYFVHVMRSHPDFVPELDYVLESGGKIVGSILYTRAKLVDETGVEKLVLSFGPLCIHPAHQRKGYGKALLNHTLKKAAVMGYEAVVIFGDPSNYVTSGFVSCRKHRVCLPGNIYPCALLVNELCPGALWGRTWNFYPSDADAPCEDAAAVAAFDAQFPPKEKAWRPSQEIFYIQSHSVISAP